MVDIWQGRTRCGIQDTVINYGKIILFLKKNYFIFNCMKPNILPEE